MAGRFGIAHRIGTATLTGPPSLANHLQLVIIVSTAIVSSLPLDRADDDSLAR